jgi:hypothetical protein
MEFARALLRHAVYRYVWSSGNDASGRADTRLEVDRALARARLINDTVGTLEADFPKLAAPNRASLAAARRPLEQEG